jgi:hypothetical protein
MDLALWFDFWFLEGNIKARRQTKTPKGKPIITRHLEWIRHEPLFSK